MAATALDSGVFGLLEAAWEAHPEAIFLVDGDRQLRYREAFEQAEALAGWLGARGVGRGDRVVICQRNRAEIAIALFAAVRIGAIFSVLNPKLKPHGLRKILRQAEPAAAVADSSTVGLFSPEDIPDAAVLCDDGDSTVLADGWTPWSEAVADEQAPPGWTGIDVDPACLVFTSGSTGDPRGVTLSHDNITFVVRAIQRRLRYRPDDRIGVFIPLAFDYGLYQIFLTAQAGATLVVGDPDQVGPRLPRILRDQRVTILPGVPTVYAALIALNGRRPVSLPELRAITNTGERLPAAYIQRMSEMVPGLEVYPMYGLTECKRVSILLPGELENRPDSVGRPLDGTEVFAVDEEGERLAPGAVGELVVRGRHVAHGYWRSPAETALRFRKRAPEAPIELYTGDRGSVDDAGYIHFEARGDDLIKHRGHRISPVEIEIEACGIEGVAEASVVRRATEDILCLHVTLSRPELTAERILSALSEVLEPAKVPDLVVVEESLPKTINGKIDRSALVGRRQRATSTSGQAGR